MIFAGSSILQTLFNRKVLPSVDLQHYHFRVYSTGWFNAEKAGIFSHERDLGSSRTIPNVQEVSKRMPSPVYKSVYEPDSTAI